MTKKQLLKKMSGLERIVTAKLPNMTEVIFETGQVLYSYQTLTGIWLTENDTWYFDKYVFYNDDLMTRTTMKHTLQWSRMTAADIKKWAADPSQEHIKWMEE